MQNIVAAHARSLNRPILTSVADSGLYMVLLAVVVAGWFASARPGIFTLEVSLILYCLFLLVAAWKNAFLTQGRRNWQRRYRIALRYSLPLVMPAFAMLSLINGGRVLAGHLLGIEAAGIYSFFFRLAAPAILAHQLITTIYFRDIYTAPSAALDRFVLVDTLVVLVAALVGFFALPWFLESRFAWLRIPEHRPLYLLLTLQMPLWAGLALIEPIIAREKRAWHQLALLLAVILAGILGAILLLRTGNLNLFRLCQLHLLTLFVAYLTQITVLRQAGLRLPLATVMGLVPGLIYGLWFWVLD